MATVARVNYVIVFCDTNDEVTRLFDFINQHPDDYKFVRKYRRAPVFREIMKEDGRVFRCKDGKAEFRMRLMFNTQNYVI